MAEFNFTKYAIEGKKEVLTRIADTINSSDGYTKSVLDELGLKYDEDQWDDLNRAEWENDARIEEHDGTTVLFFTQAYPWERASIVDWVLEEMGEPDSIIYFLSECPEDEVYETNDIEGKYFPERYRVYTEEDDDDVYFNTEEEAIAHIRKQCDIPDDIEDIEDILDWCDDNDIECAINEIEVIYCSLGDIDDDGFLID